MVRNISLWLVFGLLLLATTATACLAGQDSVDAQKCFSTTIAPKSEDGNFSSSEGSQKDSLKKERDEKEVKEGNSTIFTSNFIFYIIYKFNFVNSKESEAGEDDNASNSSPLAAFGHRIISFIYSVMHRK